MTKIRRYRSITFRMGFNMALLITILMAIVGFGNYFNTMTSMRTQTLENGWSIVRLSGAFAEDQLQVGVPNPELLRQHMENIKVNPEVSYAAIIDLEGKTVAHTDPAQVGKAVPSSTVLTGKSYVKTSTDAAGKPAGYDFFSPIITSGGFTVGYFQLGLNNSRNVALLNNIIMKSLIISLAAALAGIILARLLTGALLRKPISDLRAATESIATGDFSHRVPVHKMDELGDLAAAFNTMTGHLANLFMSVRISANELSKSSQVIINKSEEFKLASENIRQSIAATAGEPDDTDYVDKKQLQAIEEMTASAKKMARLVDRLNSLALQFKL